MEPRNRTVEQLLARAAHRTHGVVTSEELRAIGVTPAEIKIRVRRGSLLREYRGVYRVGHRAPSREAHYLAAVRACGKGAGLSGRAAAYLYGLVAQPPAKPIVTAPTERRVRGVVTHRSRNPDARDLSIWRGVPVTTVARTLVDVAAELEVDDVARACHEAGVRFKTTPAQVEEVLDRRPNSPGAGKLRTVMRGEVRVTLSKLERAFAAALESANLPPPVMNRPAGGRRVDCRWPEHGVTVELDSYRYHNSRHAWERDRQREREARARGDEFRRYTYDDVFELTTPMLTDLGALLQSRRPA